MPVYPGSLCMANAPVSAIGDKELPLLSLVSKASPDDVRGWYAKQLSGWKYDVELHHFVRPGWIVDHLLDEPEVHVVNATDQILALFKLGYDLAGMQTLIQIRYEPQK